VKDEHDQHVYMLDSDIRISRWRRGGEFETRGEADWRNFGRERREKSRQEILRRRLTIKWRGLTKGRNL